jgi:hypothetical protein
MMAALQNVVKSAKWVRRGKYRGNDAVFYIREDGLAVITDPSGEVIAGFKLSKEQLDAALRGGNVR